MFYKLTFSVIIFLSYLHLMADNLLDPYMSDEEYLRFNNQVSEAVSAHPDYLAALDSLKAAGASLKGSKSNLLPQIRLIIDSNNALDTLVPIRVLKKTSPTCVRTKFCTERFIASSFFKGSMSFVIGCRLKESEISLNPCEVC